MKIANINLIKFFLILLILGLQTPAFSEEVDPELDLKQFLSTLSGVYASRDKSSVIVSIHVNANDNSIVVIDVSGTLEFLRDIGYISEEEYKQNINIAPLERGFFGELTRYETEIQTEFLAGLNPLVPEQERSSQNSVGLESHFFIGNKSFMVIDFVVDTTNEVQTVAIFRPTEMFWFSFGYRNGFIKIF
jgi:hypothetical protein